MFSVYICGWIKSKSELSTLEILFKFALVSFFKKFGKGNFTPQGSVDLSAGLSSLTGLSS